MVRRAVADSVVVKCSREEHQALKAHGEKYFREHTKIVGVQTLVAEAPLLLGNCPQCSSTLGYNMTKDQGEETQDGAHGIQDR